MSTMMIKEEAHKLIDLIAIWDDLMHELYVRKTIDHGLTDSNAGRTKDVQKIRKKYGLPK